MDYKKKRELLVLDEEEFHLDLKTLRTKRIVRESHVQIVSSQSTVQCNCKHTLGIYHNNQ